MDKDFATLGEFAIAMIGHLGLAVLAEQGKSIPCYFALIVWFIILFFKRVDRFWIRYIAGQIISIWYIAVRKSPRLSN